MSTSGSNGNSILPAVPDPIVVTEAPKKRRGRELSRRFIAYLPDGSRVWGPFKAGNEVVALVLALEVCGRPVVVKECDRG
jgi:hypothetical protein